MHRNLVLPNLVRSRPDWNFAVIIGGDRCVSGCPLINVLCCVHGKPAVNDQRGLKNAVTTVIITNGAPSLVWLVWFLCGWKEYYLKNSFNGCIQSSLKFFVSVPFRPPLENCQRMNLYDGSLSPVDCSLNVLLMQLAPMPPLSVKPSMNPLCNSMNFPAVEAKTKTNVAMQLSMKT